MREVILPSLRSHVPEIPAGVSKPTWHIPLHVYTKKGIDLDFGPLLLFDRALVDNYSREYLRAQKRPELTPLANSIEVLAGEGFIEFRDFGSDLQAVRDSINAQVDNRLAEPVALREPLKRGIEGYRSSLPEWKARYSDYDEKVMPLGFGQHLYLMKHFGAIVPEEKEKLDLLIFSNFLCSSDHDLKLLREIERPTITYLYQNIALSELYRLPFLDVDYTDELYGVLYKGSLRDFDKGAREAHAEVRAGQHLFNCVIPSLRPSSPKNMLKLLRHKAVKDFREFVNSAAKQERLFTKEEYHNLFLEVLKAQVKFESTREKLGWAERSLSLIPVPGLDIFVSGAGMIAEKAAQRKTTGKYEWLYALIKAASPE